MKNPGLVSGLRKLEGEAPDELLLPSADALANERDTVLAETAEKFDIRISAEERARRFLTNGRPWDEVAKSCWPSLGHRRRQSTMNSTKPSADCREAGR